MDASSKCLKKMQFHVQMLTYAKQGKYDITIKSRSGFYCLSVNLGQKTNGDLGKQDK